MTPQHADDQDGVVPPPGLNAAMLALQRENAALRAEVADVRAQLARAEAAAAEAGWHVIRVLEQAPALIGVFRGPTFLLEFANAAYRAILGSRAQLARPLAEIFPEMLEQGNVALLQQAYRTGEPVTMRAQPVFLRDPLDGAISQEWSSFTYQPLRNAQGEVDSILFLAVVVTAEVRARQEVERLNAELHTFHALVERTPDAACLIHESGVIGYRNPAFQRLFGVRSRSSQVARLIDPSARHQLKTICAEILERGVWTGTLSARSADGRSFPAEVSIVRLSEPGRPTVLAALVRDRSAEEQAAAERLAFERSLFQTQKLESLGVLAGGVAHDFNNLLVAILGNADLALDDLALDNPVRWHLLQVQSAARHAADLTRQLLAYSGKGRGLVQPLNFNHVIEEMASLLNTAISRDVTLRLELEPELPPILGDVTQVRQVVMNLVTNAAEATVGSPGTVNVQTALRTVSVAELAQAYHEPELPAGRYAALVIRDQGCGMNEATIQRIFEPFFTTKFTGRGLGLSAVRGIIRSHGGALSLRSDPGAGTTFTVLWPVLHEPLFPTPPQQARVAWLGQGVILVIDDEAEVRAVAAQMLERAGYLVQVAESGPAGLALLDALPSPPTAILLDLILPHMSGDEVFAQIRQRDRGVPVILMSGYDEQDVVRRFVGRGLGGFLQKPFTQYDLQNVLRQLLGSADPRTMQ